MIEIRDYKGISHYVARDAIATVTVAATSSQWHGIRAYVKLFDGSIIESGDTADMILASMQKGGA